MSIHLFKCNQFRHYFSCFVSASHYNIHFYTIGALSFSWFFYQIFLLQELGFIHSVWIIFNKIHREFQVAFTNKSLGYRKKNVLVVFGEIMTSEYLLTHGNDMGFLMNSSCLKSCMKGLKSITSFTHPNLGGGPFKASFYFYPIFLLFHLLELR